MKSQQLKKFNLPDKPGVYYFQDKKGTLYIGKATSLRDRVRSYFAKDLIVTRGPHILDMVFKASGLKWQETDSVLEALILEASLIKKYKPYYNTKEKDDKSWNYLVITKPARTAKQGGEQFPKLLIIRGHDLAKSKQGIHSNILNLPAGKAGNVRISKTFGPFTSGGALREALKIIRRIFPFVDASSAKRDQYEFYRQLNLTPDIRFKIQDSRKEYAKNIKNIKLLFECKKRQIIQSLKKDMMAHAKRQEFVQADLIKRQIFALEHIRDVALLKDDYTSVLQKTAIENKAFRVEAYDIAHMAGKNMVGVMTVLENGIADKKEYRKFIIRTQSDANDTGALEEMLSRRFRHSEWGLPDLVVVDGAEAQKKVAEQVLKRYQFAIPVAAVVKNAQHKPDHILGDHDLIRANKRIVLLANAEAHRYGIAFHKKRRAKSFLSK